jgi:hypothetical protein
MRQLPKTWDTNYEEIYQRYINEDIPNNLNKILIDNHRDKFDAVSALINGYSMLAILEWHLHEKLDKYFAFMSKSAEYAIQENNMLIAYNPKRSLGGIEDPCFYALCSGQEQVVREYYNFVDDHFDYKEKPSKHPADWLYRVLVVLATGRYEQEMDGFLEKLIAGYSTKTWSKLMPLGLMLDAIWHKKIEQFHKAVEQIAKDHKRMIWTRYCEGVEYEVLSIRAIAICQLARMRGMKIEFDHPYIPKELIGPPILPDQTSQ